MSVEILYIYVCVCVLLHSLQYSFTAVIGVYIAGDTDVVY